MEKVALVTGTSSGIGKMVARELKDAGSFLRAFAVWTGGTVGGFRQNAQKT